MLRSNLKTNMQIIIQEIVIFALNIFDWLCTRHWVQKFGIEIEANKLARWFFVTDFRQVLLKVIIPLMCLVILYIFRNYKLTKIGIWVLLIAYGALAIYHIYLFIKIGGIMK